ncbi:MAG: HflC protein [Rhodospirillaceae bacterium]|nr:HflC protein [Rhodospirillaceae bacterium]|tara:strand:- start:1250 stop:2128 length:879 start_codon:yes stop_codon:yes gene_type:complete
MKRISYIFLLVVLIIFVVIAWSSIFTVHQTKQAIVLQFGDPRDVVSDPGLHFKLPFVQNVVRLDKRILAYNGGQEEIIASDQKRLVVDTYTRFKIVDPLEFYKSVGSEQVARSRLGAIVNANLRQVLGGVPLQSVLTEERTSLMQEITNLVNQGAEPLGLKVVDVRIKRADLPTENSEAIFRRMQAERDREAREFRAQGEEQATRIKANADREKAVLLAEANRDSQIIRGEGDAKRNAIFAKAFSKDPEFFNFYRSMLAYKQALIDNETSLILSPNSDFFRFFNDSAGKLKK